MFSNDLTIEKVNNNYFKLAKPLIFINNDIEIVVKKNFKTDGASIPKEFWVLIGHPFSGDFVESAIVHDSLYTSQILSKESSDELFYNMLKEQNISTFKASLMFNAVKMFGNNAWESKTKEEILEAKNNYVYIKIINKDKYKLNLN